MCWQAWSNPGEPDLVAGFDSLAGLFGLKYFFDAAAGVECWRLEAGSESSQNTQPKESSQEPPARLHAAFREQGDGDEQIFAVTR